MKNKDLYKKAAAHGLKHAVRLGGTLLAAGILAVGGPMSILADAVDYDVIQEEEFYDEYDGETGEGDELTGEENERQAPSRPKKYNSAEKGYITPVRDQGVFGNCWAFATIAAIEASALKDNVLPGKTKDNLDLSERHLTYYSNYNPADPLGNTDGDAVVYPNDEGQVEWDEPNSYLRYGGSETAANLKLGAYYGVVEESAAPMKELAGKYEEHSRGDRNFNAFIDETRLADTYEDACEKDILHVKSLHMVPGNETDSIKQMVMDYGAAVVSLEFLSPYMNFDNYAYYDPEYASGANHTVAIVGWDDAYSRDNFGNFYSWEEGEIERIGNDCCNDDTGCEGKGAVPEKDGAWLVKNSFGSEWGNDGYFWLSYEDHFYVNNGKVCTYEVEKAANSWHVYMHDGGNYNVPSKLEAGSSIANVYRIPENARRPQALKKISFSLMEAGKYELQLYLNPTDGADPTSGTPLLSEPVRGDAEGSYLCFADLPEDVILNPGDTYSIVLKFSDQTTAWISTSKEIKDGAKYVEAVEPGESFCYTKSSGKWDDAALRQSDPGTYRIRGYSIDEPIGNIADAEIEDVEEQVYTGEEIRPRPTVSYDGQLLREGVDYELSYADNVEVGVASVTVTGIGDFTGEMIIGFMIVEAPAPSVITPPVTEEPDEPTPPVTDKPDEPTPPVTEKPDEPTPPVTEKPDTPTPPVTDKPTPPVTEKPDEPTPPVTDKPDTPTPPVTGKSYGPSPYVTRAAVSTTPYAARWITRVPTPTGVRRWITSTPKPTVTRRVTYTPTATARPTERAAKSGSSTSNPKTGDRSAPGEAAMLMAVSLLVIVLCFRRSGKESNQ